MSIVATREVKEVTINATRDGKIVIITPVISKSSSSDLSLYMLKSVYDPADKSEQVLTISDTLDGGTI